MDATYRSLRILQRKIVQQIDNFSFLYQLLEKKEVDSFAQKLTEKFFPKSLQKNLEIANIVVDLYKAFLVLAPILQKIPYSYKLDWSRGHLLSFFRATMNKRVNRKYVSVYTKERTRDTDKLRLKLNQLGITEYKFADFLCELFVKNYDLPFLRGKLANCIFDPIMFYNEFEGYGVRIGNKFVRLEKRKYPGAINIEEQPIEILDYKIQRTSKKIQTGKKVDLKTTLEITLSENENKRIKEKIKRITESENSVAKKIILLDHVCNDFIQTHKYAKDIFYQLVEIDRYLQKKAKRIAAQDKRVKLISLTGKYNKHKSTRLLFKKPNFFWNDKDVAENVYINYFSPYRES